MGAKHAATQRCAARSVHAQRICCTCHGSAHAQLAHRRPALVAAHPDARMSDPLTFHGDILQQQQQQQQLKNGLIVLSSLLVFDEVMAQVEFSLHFQHPPTPKAPSCLMAMPMMRIPRPPHRCQIHDPCMCSPGRAPLLISSPSHAPLRPPPHPTPPPQTPNPAPPHPRPAALVAAAFPASPAPAPGGFPPKASPKLTSPRPPRSTRPPRNSQTPLPSSRASPPKPPRGVLP